MERKPTYEELEQQVERLTAEVAMFRKPQVEGPKDTKHARLIQAHKFEAISILATGLAHDFNNLLGGIRGYTELALLRVEKANPLNKYLRQIQQTVDRATDLILKLLLFSRKHPMQFSLLNMNAVIQDLLERLEERMGDTIDIETDLASNLWAIRADRQTLEQIFLNLAGNARDAMSQGGRLTISTENAVQDGTPSETMPEARPGRFVSVTLADTGTGMARNILGRIFEPFFSTKKTGEGKGLGLSLIYGIVKRHDGWTHVTSVPGKGSAFTVYFPAECESDPL